MAGKLFLGLTQWELVTLEPNVIPKKFLNHQSFKNALSFIMHLSCQTNIYNNTPFKYIFSNDNVYKSMYYFEALTNVEWQKIASD